jgi:hypothetical protein
VDAPRQESSLPPQHSVRLLEVYRCTSVLCGHLASLLLLGPLHSSAEEALAPWLRFGVLSGGLPLDARAADRLAAACVCDDGAGWPTPADAAAVSAGVVTSGECNDFVATLVRSFADDAGRGPAVTARGHRVHAWLISKTPAQPRGPPSRRQQLPGFTECEVSGVVCTGVRGLPSLGVGSIVPSTHIAATVSPLASHRRRGDAVCRSPL